MPWVLKANANNGRGELPIPLLAFFIFKILLFDFQESVVVGHQTVAEWLKECLRHCLLTFLINSHINHRVVESDLGPGPQTKN